MRRALLLMSLALIIAAIFGWLSVSGGASNARDIRDPWPSGAITAEPASINDMRDRLNNSALFPKPDAAQGQALGPDGKPLSGGSSGPQNAPPFPNIRGVSILDGQPHVTLELADGEIKTIAEGETLPSGWQLKSVDPKRIIAAYEDEEITRPIRDYAPGGI